MIHFMLTHDAQSGATLREAFAKTDVLNVKVGTFDVLLDLLSEYWLLPPVDENQWRISFTHAALTMPDAFWSNSIKTDEKSVIDELNSTMQIILNALPLGAEALPALESGSGARYARYYQDLIDLHGKMDGILPASLEKARIWYQSSSQMPLDEIIVYADDALPLHPWQRDIVDKLRSKSSNQTFLQLYARTYAPKLKSGFDDIEHLQKYLFSNELPENRPKTRRIQWLVARDAQQEVEVAAGMVQNAFKAGAAFDEMAIVIPRNGWHKDFLIQTFKSFNIPLSRAGQVEAYADIGAQWVFDALQAQDAFAAPMIFASLFSSPLMPWSYRDGQYLAEVALDNGWHDEGGNVKTTILERFSEEDQRLILAIIDWQKSTEERPLGGFVEQLQALYPLLSGRENARLHRQRFKVVLEELATYLEKFAEAEAKDLLNQIQPFALQEHSQREGRLKSVHVVYEDDYMIGEVKHLFVLGFNDGHYPRKLESAGVFSRMNWQALAEELALPLYPQEQFYEQAKACFKRQLQCATESISFLAGALDLQGTRLALSASLSDMAFCFHDGRGELDPDALLVFLEEEKAKPFFYATKDNVTVIEQREMVPDDLLFSRNIFELRKNSDGTLRPESPSSFEKLMISPLGWFFYRRGLEPKTWGIEELDVATQGTIAHGVFEECFCPENPEYDLSGIESIVERRIQEYAPFLSQPHKRLEYEQLLSAILKSAKEFKALLVHCDAKVEKTEERLTGELFGIPVAGRTDALLKMAGKNLVLDYKKSGSRKRIERMQNGFDHQLFLYRLMLDDENALTAYYTMNDATLVVDQPMHCEENLDLNIVGLENDCTINASSLLHERIEELKRGVIKLNSVGDNDLWKGRGVTASYTLEGSPLITLFMKPEGGA